MHKNQSSNQNLLQNPNQNFQQQHPNQSVNHPSSRDSGPIRSRPIQKDPSEDDDFFSIKDDDFSDGKRQGSEGKADKSFEIEVRDPQQEVGTGSKTYVSYEVAWSRNGQPQRIF